jgi:hypothetical protein
LRRDPGGELDFGQRIAARREVRNIGAASIRASADSRRCHLKRGSVRIRGQEMANPGPWTFGWTQLLTIAGLCLAFQGLRTFGKWRREKIEEKRIEVAVEALAAAYKSKYVFEHIRGPLRQSYEWQDMPNVAGESEEERKQRGSLYAVSKRLERNKDFFDHVWELQPKFMAIFGRETEEIFLLLHTARREIEVACEMLEWMRAPQTGAQDAQLWVQMRRDISSGSSATAKEGDRVGKKLEDFRTRIETLCRPIVDRELSRGAQPTSFSHWWLHFLKSLQEKQAMAKVAFRNWREKS